MGKVILVLATAMWCATAAADWTYVGASKNFSMYAETSTIRRSGDMVKMWSVSDYKEVRTQGRYSVRSQKSQQEFDCKEERVRTLFWAWFSENMGAGEHVHSNANPDPWIPIGPGTFDEILWKIACRKE